MIQGIIIILLLAACVVLGYVAVRLNNLLDIEEKTHEELKARHFQVIKDLDKTRNQLNDARADIEEKNDTIDRLQNENKDLRSKISSLETALDQVQKNVEELTKKTVKSEEPAKKTTTRKPRTKKAE